MRSMHVVHLLCWSWSSLFLVALRLRRGRDGLGSGALRLGALLARLGHLRAQPLLAVCSRAQASLSGHQREAVYALVCVTQLRRSLAGHLERQRMHDCSVSDILQFCETLDIRGRMSPTE